MGIYVLRVDNCGPRINGVQFDRVLLVGPFESHEEAYNFFYTEHLKTNPNNPFDDPRWNVVKLVEPHTLIVTPDKFVAVPGQGE